MAQKVFEQIWNQLRGKKTSYTDFLEQVDIKNLRGIKDLAVRFEFPVTVIAGANAAGKTTVLFSCACAYEVPNAGPRDYVPSAMFPNLRSAQPNTPNDPEHSTELDFYYTAQSKRKGMRWAKGKSWNRSFMGEKGGKQPQRMVYLRTLANLTSPAEVRSVLQITSKGDVTTESITSNLLVLAQRILPLKYQEIKLISKGDKNLLFAFRQQDGESAHYSEFHMSAGERAILRISKDISTLHNALILIDEIEAGLHPVTQQQMMLELQRLALRNNLQIIVTTHSAVVLESVPIEARIFLERVDDNVFVKQGYRDIFQKAFYGQSLERVSILCEDEIGEAFLRGVLDVLNPKLDLRHDDAIVGKDTGKDNFPQHIEAIGKFNQLDSFIFVLDGDAKESPSLRSKMISAGEKFNKTIDPLFLPGSVPEEWAWATLQQYADEYATEFGIPTGHGLRQSMQQFDLTYDGAADKPTTKMKNKFYAFCQSISRETTSLIRVIVRYEVTKGRGEAKVFADDLEMQIRRWRSRTV